MITQNDIMSCIIFGIIILLLIVLSVILLMGKGAWLIAGYNTLSKEGKAQYDSAALCKFIGKYLLSVGLLMPAIPVGAVFKMNWLIVAYVAYMLISTIFVIIYCNTGNRFKNKEATGIFQCIYSKNMNFVIGNTQANWEFLLSSKSVSGKGGTNVESEAFSVSNTSPVPLSLRRWRLVWLFPFEWNRALKRRLKCPIVSIVRTIANPPPKSPMSAWAWSAA